MLSIKHILCPVDFSERSEAAAGDAARLAKVLDAELTLLHVGPSFAGNAAFPYLAQIEQSEKTHLEASRRLEGKIRGLAAKVSSQARGVLAEGDPAVVIEDFVRSGKVDLLVTATHGFGGFRRYLLGSLTSKLLHDLEIPIVTGVHTEESAGFPAAVSRVGCALGLCDPENSQRVLGWAGDLAERLNAALTVIHVPTDVAPSSMLVIDSYKTLKERAEKAIAELLAKTGRTADVVIETGNPVDVVAAKLEEAGCDVLVIGRTVKSAPFRVGHADGYALIRQVSVPVFSV